MIENYNEKKAKLEKTCRKVILGDYYVNPDNYSGNGDLLPGKYSVEMLDAFVKHCAFCKNKTCDWCYVKGESCFNRLFNDVDENKLNFVLDRNIQSDFGCCDEKSVEALLVEYDEKGYSGYSFDEMTSITAKEFSDMVNREILDGFSKKK